MPAPIRLIAVDLDGTLLDPTDRVTGRVAVAVARARAEGIAVVPVTGRPERLVWEVSAEAGLGPLGVCANGAVLVDLESREIVAHSGFSGAEATSLIDLIRDRVDGVALGADHDARFLYEPGLFEGLEIAPRLGRRAVGDIRAAVAGGCLKLVARRADLSSRSLAARLSPVLRAGRPTDPSPASDDDADDTTAVAGMDRAAPDDLAEVTASDIAWVDIGPAGLTKATGLEDICGRLGLRAAEVAAIGDHFNDLPMLRWAGLAGAMGNAIPEAVALADVVVPTNAEDGAAAFIDHVLALR